MVFHQILLENIGHMFDEPLIIVFCWAVVADIATGFCKSFVAEKTAKKTQSTKGINGMIKHMVVLLLIVTIYPLMSAMGYKEPAATLVGFYILFYLVSILENLGQMGLPVPEFLRKHLAKLQDDYDHGDKQEGDK